MSDSFSKIVAMLISVVLMFIVPVKITKERQDEFNQTYVLSETIYMVDNVRNTGILSREMYDIYLKKVTGVINNCRIDIISSDKDYENYMMNTDIFNQLNTNGSISFDRNDYFKMVVYEGNKPIAYYGGSVK